MVCVTAYLRRRAGACQLGKLSGCLLGVSSSCTATVALACLRMLLLLPRLTRQRQSLLLLVLLLVHLRELVRML